MPRIEFVHVVDLKNQHITVSRVIVFLVANVTLESLQTDVTETTADAVVLVKVNGIRERSIYVNVSTYDVSALAVLNDYEAKSELVTLQSNSFQLPFLVRILDDNVVENTEEFGIRVTSSDPQVNVVNGNILVSITDNDKIGLSIGQIVYRVKETDGSVSVEVVVTGETAVDIAGSMLRTVDETAKSPDDYTSVVQNLEIMLGENKKMLQ
ncbi:tandem-95 repeat [Paramuricea clavata]|uniref:Tandem-95 repeat n=1 Tax=Paramuricea clavata TaxID=317549 RepID=A0A6S7FQV2_PARCT|nr:tandem-95 repeat [Paramuricea clavata]